MANSPRLLTKTRFTLGCDCPTKLYYTRKDEYSNRMQQDTFLKALAEGGHLVGALSQLYYPAGQLVETLKTADALEQTAALLEQEDVTIFEAAFQFQDLFIRVDILVKHGKQIQLVEVKSKSIDTNEDDPFRGIKGGIRSGWRRYILDVAFQKYVLTHACPDYGVSSYLMCVDKHCRCTVNGLNQMFEVVTKGNRTEVIPRSGVSSDDVCRQTLVKNCVEGHIEQLTGESYADRSFEQHVEWLSHHYKQDSKIAPELGAKCKKCEFRATADERSSGQLDGYRACWQDALGWSDDDFQRPQVDEIWNFGKLDRCIGEGKTRIEDLSEDDVPNDSDGKPGLSQQQRQALQVDFMRSGQKSSYVDRDELRRVLAEWKFPLHFIDFETAAPAIPMHRGLKPNAKLAFQFSHHVVTEDGAVSHAGEFLNVEPGANPNVEFLRQLKAELENDDGTIFKYSHYENTVLNQLRSQLLSNGDDVPDRNDLCGFICNITNSTGDAADGWSGPRNMVDLQKVVARYYYHPLTRGSQSLKYVLPAMLNDSEFLQTKYSQPIYGAKGGIPSLNFMDQAWVQYENECVRDPYDLLDDVFDDLPTGYWEYLKELDAIDDGGTAMTAYMRIQNEELPASYHERIVKSLLQYCELDTLAMVMLYEGWREMVTP